MDFDHLHNFWPVQTITQYLAIDHHPPTPEPTCSANFFFNKHMVISYQLYLLSIFENYNFIALPYCKKEHSEKCNACSVNLFVVVLQSLFYF